MKRRGMVTDPREPRIFFTQRPGFARSRPYLPQMPLAPLALLRIAVVEGLTQTKSTLQEQITRLRQVLHLQQELGDLSLEIQNLQETIRKEQDSPYKRLPGSLKKHQPKLAFMTRAHARQTRDKPEIDSTGLSQRGDSDEDQGTKGEQDYDEVAEDSEEEESEQVDYETLCTMYQKT